MSTTSSAVFLASRVGKGWTRPRRRSEMPMACSVISILCTAAGPASGDTLSLRELQIIAAHRAGIRI